MFYFLKKLLFTSLNIREALLSLLEFYLVSLYCIVVITKPSASSFSLA